ncbi:hypothetical protein V6x_41770 [Gimesia chilikensis]|uniref:Uncharacterized protein n=1 Tax=Gimesia chilikensis TaxID=2605989 RepID=A0A517WGR4_9PLAN|nr:hypothetical protein V6x_41770 [Gimesia chilikensis]
MYNASDSCLDKKNNTTVEFCNDREQIQANETLVFGTVNLIPSGESGIIYLRDQTGITEV